MGYLYNTVISLICFVLAIRFKLSDAKWNFSRLRIIKNKIWNSFEEKF